MIVLGLIGRSDVPECHDATACLIADGRVIGALEQERVSRRRYAPGEGAEDAIRVLLAAHGLRPSDIKAVGYAWADAPANAAPLDLDIPCGARVTDELTGAILPTLGPELGTREIMFFDHHLCHAAQAYWLNPFPAADILVMDGWGGDGSTSLFHVDGGRFRLLERYGKQWSLGVFYEAAGYYAGLGWDAAGKLMGLSSYGRPSGRRFMTFDPGAGEFRLDGVRIAGLDEERLAHSWVEAFEASVFPYTATSGNVFDYATLAADVQRTLEDVGRGMVSRLRRLSGADALLLSGGVTLNAHMNRLLARESGYRWVSGTVAPHDGGTAVGAGLLAASVIGETVAARESEPIFLGPSVGTADVESALRRRSVEARAVEPEQLRAEVAGAVGRGEIVALFHGPNEFGPRALGARSLLAAPRSRDTLDRLNRIKGRAPWRPAALSLTAEGFRSLEVEPPVGGLTEYMLCAHQVAEAQWPRAAAGVHVDGTTRAQFVSDDENGFGALIGAVGAESGLSAVINTSLNIRGEPMVRTPDDALDLMAQVTEVDLLVMPPYVVKRD